MISQPLILQRRLAAHPWRGPLTARLPGLHPLKEGEWLIRDEAFAGQMALRDDLFANHREKVFAETPAAASAQRELFALIVREVRASGAYGEQGEHLIRPDGIAVDATEPPPLVTAARLVQEDLAILTPGPDGHVLSAAAIAFPASWMLAEKMGRSLVAIHDLVGRVDDEMGARIEALLARLPADRPVQRANVLAYNDPSLHQPRSEGDPRGYQPDAPTYVRVERQTLRRLPTSGAIVFTIHTSVVPFVELSESDRAGVTRYLLSIGERPPVDRPTQP